MTNTFRYEDLQDLIRLIESTRGERYLEIEARIGRIQTSAPKPGMVQERTTFEADVGKHALQRIVQKLDSNPEWSFQNNSKTVDTFYPQNVRQTVDANGKRDTIRKERLYVLDIPLPDSAFDVRICVSRETPLPYSCGETIGRREKKRTSYGHKDTFRYDVTETMDDQGHTTHEFELELLAPQSFVHERGSKHVAKSMLCKLEDILHFF